MTNVYAECRSTSGNKSLYIKSPDTADDVQIYTAGTATDGKFVVFLTDASGRLFYTASSATDIRVIVFSEGWIDNRDRS